jgi:predicted DNA-binding ribbon-helix-helix protein
MKTTIVKRSIAIAGHKTSVSLEDAFWRGLKTLTAVAVMCGPKISLKVYAGFPLSFNARFGPKECSVE